MADLLKTLLIDLSIDPVPIRHDPESTTPKVTRRNHLWTNRMNIRNMRKHTMRNMITLPIRAVRQKERGLPKLDWRNKSRGKPRAMCRRCHESFVSNNKLHQHLRKECTKSYTASLPEPCNNATIERNKDPLPSSYIKSSAVRQATNKGYGFRGWRYATAEARLSRFAPNEPTCLDTGCTMTLVDRNSLKGQAPSIRIERLPSPINVQGLGSNIHETGEFVNVSLHLPGSDGRTAVITREAHIVEDLKAKMLVGMDVLAPEGVIMVLSKQTATIWQLR